MKHNFFKSLVILSAAVYMLAGTGCRKLEDFGDTNIDPNGSSQPVTGALLTSAESGLGGVVSGVTTGGTKAGLYAQYMSETQYTDASLYAEPNLDMSGTYTGPLMDLQVIINKNTDPATKSNAFTLNSGSNANQIAVATIIKSYYFWTLTDRWGDVPYSEALKGAGNLSPAFDKQQDIYMGLLADLKAGIAGFDAGLSVQGDIMYGGDAAKWKKLANTLRMMISLRMSKVYPTAGDVAATEFALAYNDVANGYISSNADNFTLKADAGNYKNPYYTIYESRTDYAFSKTLADLMNNMGDNRIQAFKDPGPDFPYGLERQDAVTFTNANPTYAKFLRADLREAGDPVVIVSAASSLLAAAEGVERGWVNTGSAAALYNQGITESFAQWGVSGAAAYIASGAANYATGTGGGSNIGSNPYGSVVGANALTTTPLERIALQRYLAYYPDGIQAWSEWRRTGIPHLTATIFATNSDAGKQIPIRYVYSTVGDYSLNPIHVAEAAGRLTGGDKMNSHIWWNP
ncbi:MAG: SusD/RagB family nutrient-binding outer membrane lipoprotein [Ferruginibacter sp.]